MLIALLLFLILGMQIAIFRTNLNAAELVEAFSEAIDERRRSAHRDLSELLDEGNFRKIVDISQERLMSQPNNSTLLWYKGIALFRLEEWGAAKQALEKAIELEPRFKKDLEEYLEILNQHAP